MRAVRLIVAVLTALAFIGTGLNKIGNTEALTTLTGLPAGMLVVLGALELAGALGLLAGLRFPALGKLTSACLALLMLGAIGHHVIRGDGAAAMVPALVVGVLAFANAALTFKVQSRSPALAG